jgi:hypothetical protein
MLTFKEIMKYLLTILAVLSLSACSSDAYRQADDKILCELTAGKAYLVSRGLGNASFIKSIPNYDFMCKKGA